MSLFICTCLHSQRIQYISNKIQQLRSLRNALAENKSYVCLYAYHSFFHCSHSILNRPLTTTSIRIIFIFNFIFSYFHMHYILSIYPNNNNQPYLHIYIYIYTIHILRKKYLVLSLFPFFLLVFSNFVPCTFLCCYHL